MTYTVDIVLPYSFIAPVIAICCALAGGYIWGAFALMRIAKSKGIINGWMFFLPVFSAYKLALLVDSKLVMGRVVFYRLHILYVLSNLFLFGGLITGFLLFLSILLYLVLTYYIFYCLYKVYLLSYVRCFLYSLLCPFLLPYFLWRCSCKALAVYRRTQELKELKERHELDWIDVDFD